MRYGGHFAVAQRPCAVAQRGGTAATLLLPSAPVLWHSAVVRRPLCCGPSPLVAVAQHGGTASNLLWPSAPCAVAQRGGTAAILLWLSAPVLWHSAVARRPFCCGPAPLCCGTAPWCVGHLAVSSAPALWHSAVVRRPVFMSNTPKCEKRLKTRCRAFHLFVPPAFCRAVVKQIPLVRL